MRETQAIIERVRRVAPALQQLDLSVDKSLAHLQPGQSVFARLLDGAGGDPYLREQWVPVAARAGHLVIEQPAERPYAPGQVASLLAPVGKPIPLRPNLQHLLLIAEDAAPTPLIWLATDLIARGVAVTLVLGGQAIHYPLELLPPEVEILRGDSDWKWPDQVQTLGWADQVIALAPFYAQATAYSTLYNTISQLRQHSIPENYVSGLFYLRLACGTGACQVCQIAGKERDHLACTDGPALDLKELVLK